MSDGIVSVVTTGYGTVVSNATGMLGSIVPVIIPIVGIILIVRLGIRIFKRFTGK